MQYYKFFCEKVGRDILMVNTRVKEVIRLKKYGLPFVAAGLFAIILYLFSWTTMLKYIGFGALILGLILSGTLVSGDRMRANAQSESALPKDLYLQIILFSIPVLVVYFFSK